MTLKKFIWKPFTTDHQYIDVLPGTSLIAQQPVGSLIHSILVVFSPHKLPMPSSTNPCKV
jgi:hypothetical protein